MPPVVFRQLADPLVAIDNKLVKMLYDWVGRPMPTKSRVITVVLVLLPYNASSLFSIDYAEIVWAVKLAIPKLNSFKLYELLNAEAVTTSEGWLIGKIGLPLNCIVDV